MGYRAISTGHMTHGRSVAHDVVWLIVGSMSERMWYEINEAIDAEVRTAVDALPDGAAALRRKVRRDASGAMILVCLGIALGLWMMHAFVRYTPPVDTVVDNGYVYTSTDRYNDGTWYFFCGYVVVVLSVVGLARITRSVLHPMGDVRRQVRKAYIAGNAALREELAAAEKTRTKGVARANAFLYGVLGAIVLTIGIVLTVKTAA